MSASSSQRLDAVDALRGFAALAVVLYHVWNVIFPWANTQTGPVLGDPNHAWHHEGFIYHVTFFLFQYGYFGVTIFFVISGFCIHLPQARRHARDGADGLRLEPFFLRRFWRLYPAYFAALLVSALAYGVMRFMEYQSRGLTVSPDLYWDAFGGSEVCVNAMFLLPFFPAAKGLNGVLWTLVFEVQFYLLYPVLLWCMRRVGLATVGIVLLVAEVLLAQGPKTKETFFENNAWEFFFLAKYFEWYLGVLAAELFVRRGQLCATSWAWVGLVSGVVISLGSTFVPVLWPYRDLFVAGTSVFLLAVLLQRPVAAPGRLMRSFAWVGLFSYSLYLLHYPLLRLAVAGTRFLADALGVPLDMTAPMVYLVAWLPLVVVASYGFFWVFERPFLNAKPAVIPPRVEPIGCAAHVASAAPASASGPVIAPAV